MCMSEKDTLKIKFICSSEMFSHIFACLSVCVCVFMCMCLFLSKPLCHLITQHALLHCSVPHTHMRPCTKRYKHEHLHINDILRLFLSLTHTHTPTHARARGRAHFSSRWPLACLAVLLCHFKEF